MAENTKSESKEKTYKSELELLTKTIKELELATATKTKRKIPFSMLPGAWGLHGETKEKAKIEYEFDGYDRDVKLLQLRSKSKESVEYKSIILDIAKEHDRIEKALYDRLMVVVNSTNEDEWKRHSLQLDFKNGIIEEWELEKELATLNQEPWVTVLELNINPKDPAGGGYFSLEWNDYFVETLMKSGYRAPTPELVVQSWFDTLCRAVGAEEEIAKDIKSDNTETIVSRKSLDDDNAEYS